jgi:preprotein translocase subunit SecF
VNVAAASLPPLAAIFCQAREGEAGPHQQSCRSARGGSRNITQRRCRMKMFSGVPKINFMAQRKVGLWVSSILTVTSILLVLIRGLNFGIDFTGGVLVEVHYPQAVQLDEVRSDLAQANYENPVVQFFGTSEDVLIRLPPTAETNSAKVSTAILDALHTSQPQVELRRIEFVGPQVGEELTKDGSLALLLAFIGIAVYIMFRFEWKFSVGAVAALIHDAIMVLGFLSLTWIEFDLTTVAAILALIGYSNNETIVIFDRVRENLLAQRRMEILDVVNLSATFRHHSLDDAAGAHRAAHRWRQERAQLFVGADRRGDRRHLLVDLRLHRSRRCVGGVA